MASCNVCGKAVSFGNKISHPYRHSNRIRKPNIRKTRTTNEHGAPMRNSSYILQIPIFICIGTHEIYT